MGKRKKNSITTSFVVDSKEMKESLAWRHLPDAARRALDRLELEHMRHGGADNGRLPCTHSDFARAGIRRASVALAIRQCVHLGFVKVSEVGGRSISKFRRPNLYRLTYVFGSGRSPDPTHDWRLIETEEQVQAALAKAEAERNYATQPKKLLEKQEAERREKQKAGRTGASGPDAVARPQAA
jgi:hypothetical protein